jgi:hypothetical protein
MRKYFIVSTAAMIASGIIASSAEARTRCVCQKRIHARSYDNYAPDYATNRHIYHHYYYSNQDRERHVYHHFDVSRDRDSNINVNRNRDESINQNVNVNRNRNENANRNENVNRNENKNTGRSESSARRNENASSRGMKPEGSGGGHQKPQGDMKPGTGTGKSGTD